MYGYVRRFTRRDESFCLDVVQDAMMRVIRKLTPKDSELQLLGWLRVLVSVDNNFRNKFLFRNVLKFMQKPVEVTLFKTSVARKKLTKKLS